MAHNPLTRPEAPPRTPLTEVAQWAGARILGDPGSVQVRGVSLSSQRVRPGDLYAAVPGSHAHGAAYAGDAAHAGAVAVLTDPEGAQRCRGLGLPILVVERPRAILGDLAARIYGEPGRAMTLLGVTGTQGKTTTTRLLEPGLRAAGATPAVVGTLGTRIAGTEVPTALTTPEAPDLHAIFAVMRERHVTACAMEVSSHALVMGRVDGVVFDVAGFLNLGRDHLDFHAGIEDYFAAKASLFTPRHSRTGLTNVDDDHGRRLVEEATIPMATFSPGGADADWRAEDRSVTSTGSTFTVHAPDGSRFPAAVPIPGTFNVANALCAVALAGQAGLDAAAVAAGIGRGTGVPGRLEAVDRGQEFLAVVDYAHKPDAVAAAVGALRPVTSGRLLLVLGAGGDRDRGKRPVMGELGARLADVLVVTDDNPRSEPAASIRAAILDGARSVPAAERGEVLEVPGRRDAIRAAVGMAGPGDTVLVAGKGHETGQEIGGVVHPFDDRDELARALDERGGE